MNAHVTSTSQKKIKKNQTLILDVIKYYGDSQIILLNMKSMDKTLLS